MGLWLLARLTGQAGMLDTQGKVNVTVLSLKETGRQNSFILRGPLFSYGFKLDEIYHNVEGNL
jgi:hypothetical protein